MKHTVDAIGKQCPVPVVMTKKVLDQAEQGDEIQILVDNETAVNNLSRLAGSTGCSFVSKKTADGYEIRMVVKSDKQARSEAEPEIVCTPASPQGDYTVCFTSDKMGDGDPELGEILNRLLEHVLDVPEDNTKEKLMAVPGLLRKILHVSKTFVHCRSREQRSLHAEPA